MIYIAVLMTVHNRREKTIQSLRNLLAQEMSNSVKLSVYLTDDGCTDDTVISAKELLPEITIIEGDGNLYWNRGMRVAWEAASTDRDFDFYLWLNDDTMLLPSAISHLLQCAEKKKNEAIISGCISSTQPPYTTTYCGRTKKDWISCNGIMQRLRLMHGNTVLIPKNIYHKIGKNDPYYRHAFGDYDYALTASSKGVAIYSSENFVGRCDIDNKHPKCFDKTYSLSQRFVHLYSLTSYFHPTDAFHFDMKNNGILTALGRYIYLHLSCLFPYLWRG